MKYMNISDAVNATDGKWYGSDSDLQKRITSVVSDSRKVEEGSLFVAIPGEKVDGHDFIGQVIESGAVCALSEKILDDEIQSYILVKDTRQALKDLAKYYRDKLDVKVVGVTGSVGKTSTKEMLASVLSEKFSVQKTAGNFNNEIGLPLTVFTVGEEHEIAVLEMGISDFGEMSRLAAIARPDIMVITNIGLCHLENLENRDGILKAKTECFDYLNEGASVVINGCDDKLATVSEVDGKRPYFFEIDPTDTDKFKQIDAYAYTDIIKSLGLEGTKASIHMLGPNQDAIVSEVTIPVAGVHMVYNATAAAMVGLLLGMTANQITNGISNAQAVSGRGRLIHTDKYLLVDDCYNANPVSMRAELDLLKVTKGRRVAILGDMFELGLEEVKMHYDLGAYAVSCLDVLICIGELSANMEQGAKDNTDSKSAIYYFATKEEFLENKDNILVQGDTILIKASHGMNFTIILDELQK